MKVTHQSDFDTHAVIGGDDIKEFGVAQTAEFFDIMSNAIYSNKPMAVVREVLCNAWDSHINSGVTDIPVNITLDGNSLIIRDYGKGIHPELMHPIYCIYGSSTKENDGLQTGGFGLGSKAPFAYSDHFTVTSSHAGIKTVYAISRGSALTKGKPDLRVMVQIPTLEQGLEVNIPIKEDKDVSIFKKLIRDIASYGEMNVILNREHIPIIPISTAEKNVFLCKTLPYTTNDLVHIRYGNVIYPVPKHEQYNGTLDKIIQTIDAIAGDRWSRDTAWYLIAQAPPHSISVTPSRETLSMTDTTVNTLTGIFKELHKVMNLEAQNFHDRMLKVACRDIDNEWLNGTPNKLVSLFGSQYYAESIQKRAYPEYFNKLDQIAEYALAKHATLSNNFKKKLTLIRLKSLIDGNYRRKNALINMYNIIKYDATPDEFAFRQKHSAPFLKQIIRPIIKKMVKANLSVKSLYTTLRTHSRGAIQGIEFTPAVLCKFQIDKQVELLTGTVVFASSKTAYVENYYQMEPQSKVFPQSRPSLVFIAPKKQEDRERAKRVFESMGFYIIDFYTYYQENCFVEPESTTIGMVPSKPRPEGIPSLKNNLQVTGTRVIFNRSGYRNPDGDKELIRIKDPELMFKAFDMSNRNYPKFFSFGDDYGKLIIEYWGDRSGIVANELQWEKLLGLGVKPGEPIVINEVLDYVENSTTILAQHKEFNTKTSRSLNYLRNIGKYSQIIANRFPANTYLSKKEEDYLQLFKYFHSKLPHYEHQDTDVQKRMRLIDKKFRTQSESPQLVASQEIVDKNAILLSLLDLEQMETLLRVNPSDRYLKTYVEITLINALRK